MSKNTNTIKTVVEDQVATIYLNRPECRNALNPEMINELTNVLNELEQDTEIHWLVLRGEGRSFCSGADINWFAGATERNRDQNIEEYTKLARLMKALLDSSKITIALVQGYVMGGANGLMGACDFTIAAKATKFGFSEVKLGIIPATILPFVAQRVSSRYLRKLMYSGTMFGSAQAYAIGLVDFIAEEGKEQEVLDQLLGELRIPAPSAQKACKQLIQKIEKGQIGTDDVSITAEILANLLEGPDASEGMKAFLGKRKPSWISNDKKN